MYATSRSSGQRSGADSEAECGQHAPPRNVHPYLHCVDAVEKRGNCFASQIRKLSTERKLRARPLQSPNRRDDPTLVNRSESDKMPVADDFNLERIHVDGDELLHNLGRTVRGKQGFQEIPSQYFRLFASVFLNYPFGLNPRLGSDKIHHKHRGARGGARTNRLP